MQLGIELVVVNTRQKRIFNVHSSKFAQNRPPNETSLIQEF